MINTINELLEAMSNDVDAVKRLKQILVEKRDYEGAAMVRNREREIMFPSGAMPYKPFKPKKLFAAPKALTITVNDIDKLVEAIFAREDWREKYGWVKNLKP